MLNIETVLRYSLLLLFSCSQIWACICGTHPSVKQAWQQSPVVIAGSVRLAVPNSVRTPQIVAIQAEETFKGARKGELFILMQPGHDCAPKFKIGEHGLYYLNHSSLGTWTALGCSRTQWLDSAVDDLRFLRELPGSAGKNRLAGVITLYEDSASEHFRRVRALSKVPVYIRSEAYSTETVTDSDGVYEVYGLPPGSYRIVIDIPKGLRLYFPTISGGEGPRNRMADLHVTEPVVKISVSTAADVDFVLMVDY